MRVLTISMPGQFERSLVLADSLQRFHPDWELTIVMLAERTPVSGARIRAEVVTPAQLGAELAPSAVASLDAERLNAIARGPLLRALLVRGEPVLFLDPALRVVGPLDAVESTLERAQIALAPHLLDGAGSTAALVEAAVRGVLHPGVLGVRDGDQTRALLRSWPTEAMLSGSQIGQLGGQALRAFLDGIPMRFSEASPIGPPRFVAGDWNLGGARVESIHGSLLADGEPVGLLDFSEFDPARPHLLSTRTLHTRLSAHPVLAAVAAEHAAGLRERSLAAETSPPSFDRLPDGTRMTPALRDLAADAFASGAVNQSIFSDQGVAQFHEWLCEPAEKGAFAGLTRYHTAVWADKTELRAAYPNLRGPDAVGLAGWLNVYGAEQCSMPRSLMPPAPAHLLPPGDAIRAEMPFGVNVAGFFSSELGLGEAARLLIGGLDAANVPVTPVQGNVVPACRQEAEFEFAPPTKAPFPINILCMNGDAVSAFASETGDEFFEHRYTIALWWWEVPGFPDEWLPAFEHVDEIWVASDFIYRIVAEVAPVPVYKIPMGIELLPPPPISRADLDLPERDFIFLYVYDYHSTAARKNPVGLVNAYKQAFAEDSGTALVLKCINSTEMAGHHESVLTAIGTRSDIHVIDRYVSADEKDALIAQCDCYVSPHRSEGFGLTIAEAMLLGKPVIATGHGGNTEFTSEQNTYVIPHKPVAVGDHAHPYPPDAIWAEPDVTRLAGLMRHVVENPDEAMALAARAREDIERGQALAVSGEAMRRRLEAVHERLCEEAMQAAVVPVRVPHPRRGLAKLNPFHVFQVLRYRWHARRVKRPLGYDPYLVAQARVLRELRASRAALKRAARSGDSISESAEDTRQFDHLRSVNARGYYQR